MKMTPFLAVIALVNGMIGGLMLVLPILILKSGTLLSFFIILVTGFLSYYSCYLYTSHLGDCTDIDKTIYNHFWKSKPIRVFYDLVVFINLLLILISYFLLIVQQWEGLLSYSILNPILNAVGLFGLILFLKYIRFGAHLLGYGVISIILYCIFLAWMVGSAPSGNNVIPIAGYGVADLAASMAQAFSIQQFFIPVLKQLPAKENKNYTKYITIVYIIGGLVYIFIAYAGSYGIINRSIESASKTSTIQNYFKHDQWQIAVIQSIYLLHLYSAFGEYILIAKKRFFGIFKTIFYTKNSREGQFFTIPQIIFVICVIGLGLGMFFGNVSLISVIQINGAVVGFFFIYLFPALMQFKCLYLTKRGKYIFQIVFQKFRKKRSQSCQLSERNTVVPYKCSTVAPSNNSVSAEGSQSPPILQQQIRKKQSTISQQSKKQMKEMGESNLNQSQFNNNNNNNIEQQLIPGADVSIDLSQIGQQSVQMKIQKLNEQCQCEKYTGFKKFMDIVVIFFMMALGLYVLIYGIISVS